MEPCLGAFLRGDEQVRALARAPLRHLPPLEQVGSAPACTVSMGMG